jgi:hypothetical protein
MGVLWVREKPGGKSGGQGERGYSSYHNEWLVKCSSPTMTRAEVLACGLLPVYGSPNAENTKAVCVKTDVRRQANAPCYWDASADWQESPISGRDPADEQKQPDQRIPKWSSRYVPFPVSRFIDYGGHLLCDRARTPFDPVPDMPIWCEEITVFQYEATANRQYCRPFMGATNTDTWQGAAPGEALVDDISTEMEYIQGVYWWPHTYKILIKPRVEIRLPKGGTTYVGGFDPEYVLNAGPMAFVQDAKTGKWSKKAVTHGGFYDGRPALLDINGVEIPIDPDTGQLSADPVFLELQTKTRAAFSGLNLTPPPGWS